MIDMTVDTAVRQQAENVEGAVFFSGAAHRCGEHRIFKKCLFADRFRDSRQLLVDDAACADVEMTNFGVSHLAVRESYGFTAGSENRVGIGREKTIEIRRGSGGDSIAFCSFAVSETVQYH